MTDIAELDIRADSRDLERAKTALDGLTASAAKTEQATAGIRRGLDDAAQGATRARNALGQFNAAGDQSARTFNNNATAAAGFQRSVGAAASSVEQSIAAHVRAEAAAGKWNKALDETAGKSRAAAYQIQNVRAQLIDIAVGIQGGQNLATIGFQQIPQILSAFGPGTGIRGVLSGVAESVTSLVKPLGLVGGGFAAVTAAAATAGGAYLSFDSAQKDIAVGLTGLGKQSGIARDQIEALARSSDLATTDARSLATAFAATGNATSESIANALSRSRDFAVTFKTDIEGAGKVQEEFFSNASAAYDKYAGRLGVFSAATSRQIKDFQQAGRGAEATKTALDEVNRGLTTYSENAGLVRKATDQISEGFSNLYSGLGRGTAVLGGDSRAIGSAVAIATAQRAGEIARAQADAERANTFIVDRARVNKTLTLNPVEREVKQNIDQAGLGDASKYKTVEERFAGVFSDASRASIGSFDKYPTTYGNAEERMRRAMTATPEEQKATVRRLTEDTNNIAQARALNDVSAQTTRTQQAQAQALGRTAGEAERLTTRAGLLNRAQADGVPISDANRRKIDEVSDAIGRQTQAYVEAAARREVLFQRSQFDRTPQEQGVAAGLRQVYGDQTDSPGAKVLAEQLRLNDSVRQTQMAYSTLGQMGSSLLDPLVDSTRSWSGAFSDLTRNMAKAALQAAVFGQGPFAGVFGTQGAGAGPGGIFGSLLSGAGLLGGGSRSSTGALQGPTQSGATLDAVAGNGVFSAIGLGIKSLFGFAEGGTIRGPGNGTSDSILARVSDGEFIVRASQAQRHRGLLEAINGPGLPGFATGGGVDLWGGSVLNRYANGGSVGMSAADRIFSPTPETGEEFFCDVEVRIAA